MCMNIYSPKKIYNNNIIYVIKVYPVVAKALMDSDYLLGIFRSYFYVLLMLFVFIYVIWCPTRFTYQMMFVSFNSNTTSVISREGTDNSSGTPGFTRVISCRFMILNLIVLFSDF